MCAIDIVENAGGETLVLPSTSVVLGLQFRGRVRAGERLLSVAGVTGLQGQARTYGYTADAGSVLVRFTPQGAACLGVAVGELTDRSVALDDLLPPARVAELCDRLHAATDDHARVEVVQGLLLALPFVRDPLVTRAVELLAAAHDEPSVAGVARAVGLSERQLERRFSARVGLSPKRFAKLHRFERALALARTTPSLSAVAQGAGYYDQSHFVRDFRSFAGAAPSEVLSRAR